MVHLTYGDWLIVDSCAVPATGRSAALTYLEALQIDPSSAVRLIVASHWHDDHTRGLAGIVRECSASRFACSVALGSSEARALLATFSGAPPKVARGTAEFWEAYQHLDQTGRPVRYTGAFQVLHRRQRADDVPEVVVTSLSPSDAAVGEALKAIVAAQPTDGTLRGFLPWPNPNFNAVVLAVDVGDLKILLGADLEITSGATGWSAIVDDDRRSHWQADIFKVPHHGSPGAHYEPVWRHMLVPNPIALLTPFRKGRTPLPSPRGKRLICLSTDRAFISSPERSQRALPRPRAAERTLDEADIRVRPRERPLGHIRARRRVGDDGDWAVELFNGAAKLDCA